MPDSEDAILASEETERVAYSFERDQAATDDRCFLCGVSLTHENRTDEHVFPRWLLKHHDLYRQRLVLLNRTEIPYSALTIPCCAHCNNIHLSPVENRVKHALESGVDGINALNRTDLFVWLGKIYYGLLYRELSLTADRKDPTAGTIITPEFIEQFRMHHMLLQVVRGVVAWQPNQFPASIFIFEALEPKTAQSGFDYRDAMTFPFLSLRIGSVIVVASLQDWGAMKHTIDIPMFEAAKKVALHPQQFRQIHAMGGYMASLFDRTPSHVLMSREGTVEIITLPLAGLSSKPLFRPFDVEAYAYGLAESLEQEFDDVFDGQHVVDLIGTPERPVTMPYPAEEWRRVTIS